MGSSSRQVKKAAKARLAGAIASKSPKNKKIVFGDDDDGGDSVDGEIQIQNNDNEEEENDDVIAEDENGESGSDDDDDAVEEVKGSAARESTQKLRETERKRAKDTMSKKKHKKKDDVAPAVDAGNDDNSSESEDENEEEGGLLTEDFFKMVDSERADQLQKAKKEKKIKKVQQKKKLGKHTTFVVEDEYKMIDAPNKMNQNIEVVAIGGGETTINAGEERQLLTSANLGSKPSKAAIAFARGGMKCGTSKERSSDNRKRKSKNDETWKRSRKLNKLGIGSRPGQAATLFVCKR